MDNREILTDHVKRMAASLSRMGMKHAVISPGSRSTPLAYALASTDDIRTHLQVDERSAAFFALGLAKASGEPVALLCTSGTAASNFHPAVTEAFYARVPLIVITADRPHELREVGAPQAIRQPGMFADHVKYSIDLPIPEQSAAVDDFLERQIARSVGTALTEPKGPVHLNAPFREPLLIDLGRKTPSITFAGAFTSEPVLPDAQREQISSLFSSARRGLIAAGELPPGFRKKALWVFARHMNWPVLCDPLSNLRAQVPPECRHLCIDSYDALLKHEPFAGSMHPDVVLRIGPQPVSKPLTLFLKQARPAVYAVVDESPMFRDPLGISTHHLQTKPEDVLTLRPVTSQQKTYTERWSRADELAAQAAAALQSDAVHEGEYVQTLLNRLPDGSDLISGSSMPIRDLDTYFRNTPKDIACFSNRGANGIDGVVSTALGIQASRRRPAWLLIGDLSFLHDSNGLIMSRMEETDLTIVLSNNNGGGIFSYLPQSTEPAHFEELFGTPTGLSFAPLAAMYDVQYSCITTVGQLEDELAQPKTKPLRIIEMMSDRAVNTAEHRALWQAVREELEKHGM